MVFSKVVSSSALLEMEQHDDALAKIANANIMHHMQSIGSTTASSSLSSSMISTVPSVHRNDLYRISLIGSGKFCHVHLVSGPSSLLNNDDSSSLYSSDWSNDDRRCARTLFAFKSIDPSRVKTVEDLTIATTELANEAKILSQLDHENVIKLRGISSEPFSQSYSSGGEGYFMVLDVLTETLSDRLQQWRRQKHYKVDRLKRGLLKRARRSSADFLRNSFSKVLPNSPNQEGGRNKLDVRRKAMYDRIEETVLGIASGMEYLHARNIVLRDLKPANIGYDDIVEGNSFNSDEKSGIKSRIRLIDFGMAAKVDKCNPDEICGSLRYMAPEVMAGKGYSLEVDVYSFGVILFEICSLQVPFAEYNCRKPEHKAQRSRFSSLSLTLAVEKRMMTDFYKGVAFYGPMQSNEKLRKLVPCPKLRDLIQECWGEDPTKRPSFQEINTRLFLIFNRDDYEDHVSFTSRTSNDCGNNTMSSETKSTDGTDSN